MANIVHNMLTITGPKNQEILKALQAHGMNYFKPQPAAFTDKTLFDQSDIPPAWLHFSKHCWGTKWDIYKEYRILKDNTLSFDTANSGIEPFLEHLQNLFPDVVITYVYAEI